MSSLPAYALQFLSQPVRPEARHRHPKWLVGDPDARRWKVITSESRYVNGKWRGLTTLRWDFEFPAGSLAEHRFQLVVHQAKSLLLELYDIGQQRASAELAQTHSVLIQITEFQMNRNAEEVIEQGLACFDSESAAALAAAYAADGAVGVARFLPRLHHWLDAQLTVVGRDELVRWLMTQNREERKRILNFRRAIQTSELDGLSEVLVTEHRIFLRWARLLLAYKGAYDVNGILNRKFIAEAIKTDAARFIRSSRFSYQLRQYETATDYSRTAVTKRSLRTEQAAGNISDVERHDKGVASAGFVRCILSLSGAASKLPEFDGCDFADTAAMQSSLATLSIKFSRSTRLVPKEVARALIRGCIDWVLTDAPGLVRVLRDVRSKMGSISDIEDSPLSRMRQLEKCFSEVREQRIGTRLPPTYWGQIYKQIRGKTGDSLKALGPLSSRPMGVADLANIHVATCISVTALFSCSRVTEVLELQDSDLEFRAGRWYLTIRVRKKKSGEVRQVLTKPVPPIVAICLRSLMDMRDCLESLLPETEREPAGTIFRVMVENNRVVSGLRSETVYTLLELLSEYLDFRTKDGIRWVVAPHELRKFFAYSFFHDGARENSLPALTWFMGHGEDIASTYAYVKPYLEADEAASIEATWAATALRTQPEQDAVQRLTELLQKEFGVNELSVLDEDELQEYLELLQRRGVYTTELKPIRNGKGQRFTVLVHIKGDNPNA